MKVNLEIKNLIKNSKSSYTSIISNINKKFKIELSKSTISYYKRSRDRITNIHLENVEEKDLEWLKGLFIADGCKFVERRYAYTIKLALDKNKDKSILNKLKEILKGLGCKFSIKTEGNIFVIRLFSKTLFNILPNKNKPYIPREPLSFLAGLIDGDGCKKGNSAILVQYRNISMLRYLSNLFGLKVTVTRVKTNYGKSIRRQYYIPRYVCDLIRDMKLSEKLKGPIAQHGR